MKILGWIMGNKLLTVIVAAFVIFVAYYAFVSNENYITMEELDNLAYGDVVDGQIITVRGEATRIGYSDALYLETGEVTYYVYLDNSERYFKIHVYPLGESDMVKVEDTLEIKVRAEKDFVLWFSVVEWRVVE